MYLVIETHVLENGKISDEFIHFIDLNKYAVQNDINSFVKHLYYYKNQVVDKVYYSQTRLTSW